MNTRLQQLHDLGQSIWYDKIRRALLDSGRLAEYVEEYAVTGVTSNPTIFERTISGSSDYDAALARRARPRHRRARDAVLGPGRP